MAKNEDAKNRKSIGLKGFSDQELEYQLMEDINDAPNFQSISNDEVIYVDQDQELLVIRYHYKNKDTDGFQISEITGNIRLVAFQFRMEKEQGKLWSYNVFKIKVKGHSPVIGFDSDMEPPEPPIP